MGPAWKILPITGLILQATTKVNELRNLFLGERTKIITQDIKYVRQEIQYLLDLNTTRKGRMPFTTDTSVVHGKGSAVV